MPYQTFSRKGMPKLFYHKKGCQWSSFSRKGMPKGPLVSDWPIISQEVRIVNATSHPATEQPISLNVRFVTSAVTIMDQYILGDVDN